MNNTLSLKILLVCILFSIAFYSCKKSKEKITNKVLVLKEKSVKINKKEVTETCNLDHTNTRISLLKDSDKNVYLNVKIKEHIFKKKINLENFNELYSVHLKCNYDTTFQLIFTEKIGNNYQDVIHLFHKDINSIFILSTVYIQTSNRNGIHLLEFLINM